MYSQTDELKHYGALGMKWGVRKNPSKAYTKAVRKKQQLDTESAKVSLKAAKAQSKATKKLYKARDEDDRQLALTQQHKADQLAIKAAKLRDKGTKWTRQMDKTFAAYNINRVPKKTILGGKKYVYELTKKSS